MPMPDSESVFVIPGSVLLWRIAPRPPNSAQVRPRSAKGSPLHSVPGSLSPRLCLCGLRRAWSLVPKSPCPALAVPAGVCRGATLGGFFGNN